MEWFGRCVIHSQLMEILTNDENSDTISWLPHGRSFIIYKKKKFAAKILVKYFKVCYSFPVPVYHIVGTYCDLWFCFAHPVFSL